MTRCPYDVETCFDRKHLMLHMCDTVRVLALAAMCLQAVKAAKAAEAEVSKLNYRIEHLVRSLRAADHQLTASSKQH